MPARRHKTKLLFYRPWMMSFLFIAIGSMMWIQENLPVKRLGFIHLNMPDEKDTSAFGFGRRSLPYRRYKEIYLLGNDDDEYKVLQGQLILRSMREARDTVHGLKFVYTNKTTYATYIATLDLCRQEDMYYYGHFEDSFLIFMRSDEWRTSDTTKLEIKPFTL